MPASDPGPLPGPPAARRPDRRAWLLGPALDTVLVAAAAGLHLLACARKDVLPPVGGFETGLVVLPLLAQIGALALLLARGDRRGLGVACVFQWLLVLYLLPVGFLGLVFAPPALALTYAAVRPRP